MPRNVRPCWISARIDGRASPLAGGPKSRNGKIRADFYLRDAGAVGLAFRLESFSGPMLDGEHVRFGVEIETRTKCAHAELPDGTLVTLPPGTRVRIYGAPEAR